MTIPELPKPLCTFADNSYPAYKNHQMTEYAEATLSLVAKWLAATAPNIHESFLKEFMS